MNRKTKGFHFHLRGDAKGKQYPKIFREDSDFVSIEAGTFTQISRSMLSVTVKVVGFLVQRDQKRYGCDEYATGASEHGILPKEAPLAPEHAQGLQCKATISNWASRRGTLLSSKSTSLRLLG